MSTKNHLILVIHAHTHTHMHTHTCKLCFTQYVQYCDASSSYLFYNIANYYTCPLALYSLDQNYGSQSTHFQLNEMYKVNDRFVSALLYT